MNLGKVGIASPHVEYEIQVTHRTQRKSTAMEWLLLEIAQKVSENPNYEALSLDELLKSLFCITDGKILLRQVLLDLIDRNALKYIRGFSSESDWSRLRCGDLKLTEIGSRLQREGQLPSKEQRNNISVIYDVVNSRIVENDKNLSDDTTYIKIMDISPNNLPGFPDSLISEHIEALKQKSKKSSAWLQKNSLVDSIELTKNPRIKWKNSTRQLLADDNGNLSLEDESDTRIIDDVLKAYDFGSMPDCELPVRSVSELEEKIFSSYDKAEEKIFAAAEKTEVFLVVPKFAKIVESLNQKICIVTEQNSFGIEVVGDNTIIRVPNVLRNGLCYQDLKLIISACVVNFHRNEKTWRVPYICERREDFAPFLLKLAKEYFLSEPRILKLLQFIPDAPYQEFYSEEFIRMKLNSPPAENFTPLDNILERLPKIIAKAKELLPNLFDCNEIRLVLCEKDASALHNIHDLITQWNSILNSLREKFATDLNSIDWKDDPFGNSLKFMRRVEEAISLFFDSAGEHFDKVYVLELEALLHYPALLDDFNKKREMVIVPKAVLADLKNLSPADEEISAKNAAARAIQKIDEHSGEKWLYLDEEYHAELLADDASEFPILSTILKYKVKNPVLVTDNAEIKNFAESREIEVVTAKNLHERIGGSSSSKSKSKSKKRNGR